MVKPCEIFREGAGPAETSRLLILKTRAVPSQPPPHASSPVRGEQGETDCPQGTGLETAAATLLPGKGCTVAEEEWRGRPASWAPAQRYQVRAGSESEERGSSEHHL